MKFNRLFAIVAVSVALHFQTAYGITAEDLASFFSVTSWHTTVSLPPKSFTVQILQITDGKIGNDILAFPAVSSYPPEPEMTIMIGPHNDHYKIVVMFAKEGSYSTESSVAPFGSSISNQIPAKIAEGDFMLLGQAKPDGAKPMAANDFRAYSSGFLLRIRKK